MPGRSSRRRFVLRAPRGRARVCALALGTTLIALAGCGGGSSATTKAQYVAKVNALCTSEEQQLTQTALAKGKITAVLDHDIAIREQVLGEIEAVKKPSSEPISPEWLELRRKALALAKRISALGLGSRAAQPLNLEYVTVSNKALRIGNAYGLTACHGFAGV